MVSQAGKASNAIAAVKKRCFLMKIRVDCMGKNAGDYPIISPLGFRQKQLQCGPIVKRR